MGDVEEACNTGLFLGLGVGGCTTKQKEEKKKKKKNEHNNTSSTVGLGLSFSINCLSSRAEADDHPSNSINNTEYSTRSSFHNSFDQSLDDNNSPPRSSNNDAGDFNGGRKKLRLTREQSTLLEESFKLHTTLTPAQKQSLADQLKLKPRQVEVWFQNRRARSKLKQTEVDCEFLKKCCETLSDENRKLKKELQELRSSSPYIQAPTTAAVMLCPSCEELTRGNSEASRKDNRNV